MKVKKISFHLILFLFPIILTSNLTQLSYPQSTLNITVTTDKQVYKVPKPGETVQISGNLTLNDLPVSDALVALQINTRIGAFIYRTLHTGTIPTYTYYIEILDAYIGNSLGDPLTNVKRGSTVWIWIHFQNNLAEEVYTVIAYTIYSATGSPLFAFAPVAYNVPPGGPFFSVYSWEIPSDAELGTATIYASAFSEFPKNGGVPYCPEKSSTFNIISSETSTTQHISNTVQFAYEEGTFNSSFYIPSKGGRLGNYTIYVNSHYLGQNATDTMTFEVKLLGDIDRDGFVKIGDIVSVINHYGTTPSSPNWDPNADVNGDGKVYIDDIVITINNFGNSGTY